MMREFFFYQHKMVHYLDIIVVVMQMACTFTGTRVVGDHDLDSLQHLIKGS